MEWDEYITENLTETTTANDQIYVFGERRCVKPACKWRTPTSRARKEKEQPKADKTNNAQARTVNSQYISNPDFNISKKGPFLVLSVGGKFGGTYKKIPAKLDNYYCLFTRSYLGTSETPESSKHKTMATLRRLHAAAAVSTSTSDDCLPTSPVPIVQRAFSFPGTTSGSRSAYS